MTWSRGWRRGRAFASIAVDHPIHSCQPLPVVTDPLFYVAEGHRVRLDMNPLGAERVTEFVNTTINASPNVVAKARMALGADK